MTAKAISPLRQRLIENMTIRRLGPKTQDHDIRHVKSFADFLGRSPDTATAEDVHRCQLRLASIGVTVRTVNVSATALRFFFKVTRAQAASALPSGLAQSLDQVGVVFWPKPRHAVPDIHVECGRRERDGLSQRFLCFCRATELTERGGGPAIDHWKIGVRPDQLFGRLDRLLVFSGEIKTASNVQQTYRRKRIARIEPNTRLDRCEPLLRPSRED
jgi:integrase/recombinase XerD